MLAVLTDGRGVMVGETAPPRPGWRALVRVAQAGPAAAQPDAGLPVSGWYLKVVLDITPGGP